MSRPMPNTNTELMTYAASALANRDIEYLEDLMSHTEQWLGLEEEQKARRLLLNEMVEAAYDLIDYDEE